VTNGLIREGKLLEVHGNCRLISTPAVSTCRSGCRCLR
jgi:hypothetical protein